MSVLPSAIVIECREVAGILGNSEALDLTVMREFLKSDWDDFEGVSPKFNFNSSPKMPRATKWENVLCSLKNTFFVERGMFHLQCSWTMVVLTFV